MPCILKKSEKFISGEKERQRGHFLGTLEFPTKTKTMCFGDCNWTRTHNHLVRTRTLNHLAKLAKL